MRMTSLSVSAWLLVAMQMTACQSADSSHATDCAGERQVMIVDDAGHPVAGAAMVVRSASFGRHVIHSDASGCVSIPGDWLNEPFHLRLDHPNGSFAYDNRVPALINVGPVQWHGGRVLAEDSIQHDGFIVADPGQESVLRIYGTDGSFQQYGSDGVYSTDGRGGVYRSQGATSGGIRQGRVRD